MSALFNQTNSAPGTSFATGGGSSLNPVVQSVAFTPVSACNIVSNQIASGFNPFDGTNNVAIYNGNTNQLARLQVGGNLEVQESGNGPTTALQRTYYGPYGITWVQPNTGTSYEMSLINAATQQMILPNLSTIAAGGSQIKIGALVSTLTSAYPGVIG